MKLQRFWNYRGLFVLVLWQATPTTHKSEDGRVEFGFGYGFAEAEEIFYPGCESEAQQSHFRRKAHAVGASVSTRPSPRLRISGTASLVSADSSSLGGAQVTGLIAGEWKWFGGGLGFLGGGVTDGVALYLRAGRADQLHLRLEAPSLTSAVHTTGMVRAGVGYGLSDSRSVGGFIGYAGCHVKCEFWDSSSLGDTSTDTGGEGWRADLQFPIGNAFNLDLSGFLGDSERYGNWGLAIGGRMAR